jgi:hypothetical protein
VCSYSKVLRIDKVNLTNIHTKRKVHKRIIYKIKRVEFILIGYLILRGYWCYIIVLSLHALTEEKIDDVKDSFYEQ